MPVSRKVMKKVMKYMPVKEIKTLQWHGNFPDLNPIENLWGIVKKRLRNRDCTKKTKRIESVIHLWFHDQEVKEMCKTLIFSMPRRVELLIRAKGGHIKY